MEILCARCGRQLKSDRQDFQDVFFHCRLDSETDVSDSISDPIKNSTDKVSSVVKTSKCSDFKDKILNVYESLGVFRDDVEQIELS